MKATRFANLPAWAARVALAVLALFLLLSLSSSYVSLFASNKTPLPEGKGDIKMYQAIVERMRAGEGYYQAAGEELRTRGYALKPFVNWRLPTTAWLVAAFPNDTIPLLLIRGLTVVAVLAWALALVRATRSKWRVFVGTLLICSALLVSLVETSIYFHESWAALLVALSLALYDPKRWYWSVLVGTLAMLFRELALLYVGAMVVAALLEGRRREALGWLAGIAVFGIVLAIHASIAISLTTDADRAKTWLYGGGWGFVLSTAQWTALAAFLPTWFFALAVPLSLVGAAAWRHALGLRISLALGAYFCTFMLIGRPDNIYWGLLYSSLLPIGLLYIVPAIRDLVEAAFPTLRKRQSLSIKTR